MTSLVFITTCTGFWGTLSQTLAACSNGIVRVSPRENPRSEQRGSDRLVEDVSEHHACTWRALPAIRAMRTTHPLVGKSLVASIYIQGRVSYSNVEKLSNGEIDNATTSSRLRDRYPTAPTEYATRTLRLRLDKIPLPHDPVSLRHTQRSRTLTVAALSGQGDEKENHRVGEEDGEEAIDEKKGCGKIPARHFSPSRSHARLVWVDHPHRACQLESPGNEGLVRKSTWLDFHDEPTNA